MIARNKSIVCIVRAAWKVSAQSCHSTDLDVYTSSKDFWVEELGLLAGVAISGDILLKFAVGA